RRTATATPSGVMPNRPTPGPSAMRTAAATIASPESTGRPRSAALIESSALSGSRKKSPLTWTSAMRPSSTDRSTTTSLPPDLAAHRHGDAIGGDAEQADAGPQRHAHRGGDHRFAGIDGQAAQRRVDRIQRAVGLEEEIAADLDLGNAPVLDGQVDDDQLAP